MILRHRVSFAATFLPALLVASAALASESHEREPLDSQPRESDLDLALAGVVDTRLWPEEAAALERRPYRMLLDRVRTGPDEITMSHYVAECRGSVDRLLRSPDEFRGRSVYFTTGIIVELRRVEAPGVGRFDRDEVYACIIAEPRSGPDPIKLWAVRALRLAGEPRLYPGDRVNVSGYFFKNIPVVDARGGEHWMPLLVCPWPTYYGKWTPIGPVLRAAGAADLFPTREYPHEELRSRPVMDVHADGRVALDGTPLTREETLAELRRYAFAHPGRAVVARPADSAAEEIARDLKEQSGLRRMLLKELPVSAAR